MFRKPGELLLKAALKETERNEGWINCFDFEVAITKQTLFTSSQLQSVRTIKPKTIKVKLNMTLIIFTNSKI